MPGPVNFNQLSEFTKQWKTKLIHHLLKPYSYEQLRESTKRCVDLYTRSHSGRLEQLVVCSQLLNKLQPSEEIKSTAFCNKESIIEANRAVLFGAWVTRWLRLRATYSTDLEKISTSPKKMGLYFCNTLSKATPEMSHAYKLIRQEIFQLEVNVQLDSFLIEYSLRAYRQYLEQVESNGKKICDNVKYIKNHSSYLSDLQQDISFYEKKNRDICDRLQIYLELLPLVDKLFTDLQSESLKLIQELKEQQYSFPLSCIDKLNIIQLVNHCDLSFEFKKFISIICPENLPVMNWIEELNKIQIEALYGYKAYAFLGAIVCLREFFKMNYEKLFACVRYDVQKLAILFNDVIPQDAAWKGVESFEIIVETLGGGFKHQFWSSQILKNLILMTKDNLRTINAQDPEAEFAASMSLRYI